MKAKDIIKLSAPMFDPSKMGNGLSGENVATTLLGASKHPYAKLLTDKGAASGTGSGVSKGNKRGTVPWGGVTAVRSTEPSVTGKYPKNVPKGNAVATPPKPSNTGFRGGVTAVRSTEPGAVWRSVTGKYPKNIPKGNAAATPPKPSNTGFLSPSAYSTATSIPGSIKKPTTATLKADKPANTARSQAPAKTKANRRNQQVGGNKPIIFSKADKDPNRLNTTPRSMESVLNEHSRSMNAPTKIVVKNRGTGQSRPQTNVAANTSRQPQRWHQRSGATASTQTGSKSPAGIMFSKPGTAVASNTTQPNVRITDTKRVATKNPPPTAKDWMKVR